MITVLDNTPWYNDNNNNKGPRFAYRQFQLFNNNSETISNSWAQLCSAVKLKVYYTCKHQKK